MTLTIQSMARVPAACVGAAAALVLCLATPEAILMLGCIETGILTTCLSANGEATLGIQPLLFLGLVFLAASFAAAVAFEGMRHARLARELHDAARPAWLVGQQVGLVAGIGGAVVAGMARPSIYCSPDLVERLDGDELEAVLLHERHHQRTWAPLDLVVLAAVGHLVDRSEAGRAWLARRRAAIEIAADAHVLAAGVPRTVLARAVLKLMEAGAGETAAGFAGAADLRLRTLLGEGVSAADRARNVPTAGVITFLVVCITLV